MTSCPKVSLKKKPTSAMTPATTTRVPMLEDEEEFTEDEIGELAGRWRRRQRAAEAALEPNRGGALGPPRSQTRHCTRVTAFVDALIGPLAQLGERLHGMQEVSGSIPLGSTNFSSNAATHAGTSQRRDIRPDKTVALEAVSLRERYTFHN